MLANEVVSAIVAVLTTLGGLALATFLVWVFLPEKIERWTILLDKLLSYASEKHERRYIAKNIESRIRNWRTRTCRECKGIIPYDFEIKWAKIEDVESELREGKLLVKMKNHRNQSKNYALAVAEYVPNTLMPKARRYIEPLVMSGIDYVLSKHALSGDTRALAYFADKTESRFQAEPDLKEVVNELDIINSQGRLSRILLSEYDTLSVMFPNDANQEVQKETLDFEKLIFNLAAKKPDEDVKLSLLGKNIQASIILVANPLKLLTAGIQGHLNRVKKELDSGANCIFITAVGRNISYGRELCIQAAEQYDLETVFAEEYNAVYLQRPNRFFCAFLKRKS